MIESLEVTLKRIREAPEDSPIAVFRSNIPGRLRAVFGDTAYSHKEIKKGHGLVGVFHGYMDLATVEAALRDAVGGEAFALDEAES